MRLNNTVDTGGGGTYSPRSDARASRSTISLSQPRRSTSPQRNVNREPRQHHRRVQRGRNGDGGGCGAGGGALTFVQERRENSRGLQTRQPREEREYQQHQLLMSRQQCGDTRRYGFVDDRCGDSAVWLKFEEEIRGVREEVARLKRNPYLIA